MRQFSFPHNREWPSEMTPASQKVALVTGAARGIGFAVAKRFLADGWRIALLDIEDQLLRKSVEALGTAENTLELHCDVSDAAAVARALTEIEQRFGRLDALVNNAGIAVFAPVLETSNEDWERVLAVNLTGPFLCTKAAVPLMREHGGGAIVNITSISSLRASTLRSAYGTSKAGLAHLTKQLAVELASFGIRVNGVAPGPVETAMARARRRTGGSGVFSVQRARQLHHRTGPRRRWRLRRRGHRSADPAWREAKRVELLLFIASWYFPGNSSLAQHDLCGSKA
jgi:NAD(P)-dependent dehydrogenase (short-subunit alcohol dehydrogenase family)